MVAIAGVVLFWVSAAWLVRLDAGGPPHESVALPGGIPGTLYLPDRGAGSDAFRVAPPREERPPAVALMHGFATDRLGLGTLARRLASAGFAVLAFDVRGHGDNRNPFAFGRGTGNTFEPELTAVVDFLRASPLVDGERIAVAGHSMGASASLDYATRDSGVAATVLVAGGAAGFGPHRPVNALLVYAESDPESIQRRAHALASRLAGVESAERSRTYGDPLRGDAVRLVEIAGTDHVTVIYAEATAREIIAWLDASFGETASSRDAVPADPRLPVALWNALSLLLVLPALGFVVGRLAPEEPAPPLAGVAGELGGLALALALVLPLAAATPFAFLPLEVADVVVGHLSLAGILAGALLALRGASPLAPGFRAPRALAAAGLGIVAAYVLLLPVSLVSHRMTLTPERLVAAGLATLALLPFACVFQRAVRRGTPLQSLGLGLAGRALAVGVLVGAVSLGLFPSVLTLMLPTLTLVFLGLELLGLGVYAASRNAGVIAWIDAAWLCVVVAAVMPIRL